MNLKFGNMSLYNAIFGTNPAAALLLGSLGLDSSLPKSWEEKLYSCSDEWGEVNLNSPEVKQLIQESKKNKFYPTGRFRDIYFERDEEGTPKVILYTRNGGGNRPSYRHIFKMLSNHPDYIKDYDDDFDSTYAYIEFKAPEIVIEFFQDFESKRMDRIGERFRSEIQLMEEGKEVNKNMKEFMSKIVEMIETQNQK